MPPRLPLLPPRTPLPSLYHRLFTTTPQCLATTHKNKKPSREPMKLTSAIPPYPFGPSLWYKQSNAGLYGTAKIRFGNIVSKRNEIKTRRYWHPNIQRKRLWSVLLGRMVRVRVTTRVMRTVDKCGGLDEYLLGEKPARIKELGQGGWVLRWRVMQTEGYKARLRGVWEGMGLPEPKEVLLGEHGSLSEKERYVTRELLTREAVKEVDEMLAKEDEEDWVDIGNNLEGGEGAIVEEEVVHLQSEKEGVSPTL